MTTKTTSAQSPLQYMRPGGPDTQMPYFWASTKMGRRSYEDFMPTMRELLRNAERRHTRATIQDVCINYIRGLCQRASRCSRIHPVDKTPFLEILHKRPRNRNPAHQMYSNDPWRDHAHSVEPSVSLMESPQSFFEDLTDQELRGGDAPSKHDTSTGSWDAQTGCWVMPCHAEIWESDSRVQGIFENRRKIQEGCFF